jgi:lipopolysaccharide export system permease protein
VYGQGGHGLGKQSMAVIDRYIIRLIGLSGLAALCALTLVIWISQAMHDVDLITNQGQSLLKFLAVTGLTLPAMAAIIGPVAFFIGLILALNRMNADSELAVLHASGLSPLRLSRPILITATLALILCAGLTTWVVPASIQTWRTMITQIRSDFLTKIVKPGRFNELEKDVVFHYRERSGDALLGIFIQDSRDPELVLVYVAEHGRIIAGKDSTYLILENGSVQRETRRTQDASIVAFQRYALDLTQLAPGNDDVVFQPHERLTSDLVRAYFGHTETSGNEIRIGSELADRFSTPLFTLTFASIGLAFLGRPRTTRSGTATGIIAAIFCGAVLRILGFAMIVGQKSAPYVIELAVLFPIATGLCILLMTLVFARHITGLSFESLIRRRLAPFFLQRGE